MHSLTSEGLTRRSSRPATAGRVWPLQAGYAHCPSAASHGLPPRAAQLYVRPREEQALGRRARFGCAASSFKCSRASARKDPLHQHWCRRRFTESASSGQVKFHARTRKPLRCQAHCPPNTRSLSARQYLARTGKNARRFAPRKPCSGAAPAAGGPCSLRRRAWPARMGHARCASSHGRASCGSLGCRRSAGGRERSSSAA